MGFWPEQTKEKAHIKSEFISEYLKKRPLMQPSDAMPEQNSNKSE
jgi:hypothetical protein